METDRTKNQRNSSLELFRIISMMVIVAHHYVVNSQLTWGFTADDVLSPEGLFAIIFGWGGKTGINCFVLITGYFMCTSKISVKKFLKMFMEIIFYKLTFYIIFCIAGYEVRSVQTMLKRVLPIYDIGTGFIGSFLFVYLCIPYLNIVIQNLNQRLHLRLVLLCIGVFSILPSFFGVGVPCNYVIWFMILYLCASYIRLYPHKLLESTRITGILSILFLVLSWISVVMGAYNFAETGSRDWYGNVQDSNKFLAFATAACAFMFFKNLKMKYHPIINTVAASAFGVLLIHANSDSMRKWLWIDTLENAKVFYQDYFVLHAIISVLAVYVICTGIDFLRIQLLEKPLFKISEKILTTHKS